MRFCQRTHQGLVRTSNQDSLIVDNGVYGVADGMGGHRGGETASRLAVQVLKTALHGKMPEQRALEMSIEAANRRIFDMARRDASLAGMGTTVTFLWESDNKVMLAHVGDSRAYLLRDGVLRQITEDHSMVADLVRNRVITPEVARTHPYRNIITRAVGVDPFVVPDILTVESQPDDIWLICSDGLYNMVSDEQMLQALQNAPSDEDASDQLLKLALDGGGTDNISFVLCRNAEVNAL